MSGAQTFGSRTPLNLRSSNAAFGIGVFNAVDMPLEWGWNGAGALDPPHPSDWHPCVVLGAGGGGGSSVVCIRRCFGDALSGRHLT